MGGLRSVVVASFLNIAVFIVWNCQQKTNSVTNDSGIFMSIQAIINTFFFIFLIGQQKTIRDTYYSSTYTTGYFTFHILHLVVFYEGKSYH